MPDIIFYLKKYLREIIFGILICICIGISCYGIFYEKNSTEIIQNDNFVANTSKEERKEEKAKKIHIDIKGAIKTPGVYEVEEGAIVSDVITLAGGFNEDADQESINLSKKVSDEMVIYIYTTKELKSNETKKSSSTTSKSCNSSSYSIKDCVEKKESIIIPGENNAEITNEDDLTTQIININTASKTELMSLNGIGEVKAEAIIDYRNKNGNFKSIEEIGNVKGIGDVIFAKIIIHNFVCCNIYKIN